MVNVCLVTSLYQISGRFSSFIFSSNSRYYGWIGTGTISFFGRYNDVTVYIQSANENAPITEAQKQAYINFMEKLPAHQQDILDKIYNYYLSVFACLYDDTANAIPLNREKFCTTITPNAVIVGYQDKPNEISTTFQCTWAEENGVGICLQDMEIEDIGYSSIAF